MRGVSLIEAKVSSDSRGFFSKILDYEALRTITKFEVREVFITTSKVGTLRGMHLQIKEAENWRAIHVSKGTVFDVLLDLRKEEPTFKSIQTNILASDQPRTLIVPPGVAHGFQALTDAEMLYISSHEYNSSLDTGINPFSIQVDWPIEVSAISERDLNLKSLSDFEI
jgi:dTDP-4-dehydrorhamnose 3,5-epimerase